VAEKSRAAAQEGVSRTKAVKRSS